MSGEDSKDSQSAVSDSERLLFGGELAYDVGWDQHEGAWLKLGLWTMAKGLPRMVGTGLRLSHLADARALRVVLGAEVGRGVVQAIGLVAVNAVLGHILARGGTNERLTSAFPALIVVAVAALVGSLLRSASTAATGELEPTVQRGATEQYLGWCTGWSSRRSRTTSSTGCWTPPGTVPTPPGA
ncbi:hypothetical protein [Streptomyces virginiae]|uniref:hypothetical protein n=1 Tax=Streptomyces virginiae TaxID=1961 RepID=UPI0036F6DE4B